MDILIRLSSLLQRVLPAVQPSAALYIFRPASADKISLVSLMFLLLVFSTLPSCAYILLLLLTVHVASTCLLHSLNIAKLQTAEELLSPAQAQIQLLKVKHMKLEAVIDQVSDLKASIAAARQQEQELASTRAQLEQQQAELQRRLEGMDELRSRIHLMHQRLAPLPGLHTRFQMLRHKAKVHSWVSWACKLLRAETSRMDELLQEYNRLKAARTQMQVLQADIAHAQREVDEVAALQAHLHKLKEQAAQAHAVQAEITTLEREAADLQDLQRKLAGLKAAKDKENLPGLAEQGSVNKPHKPQGPVTDGVHCIKGITTTSSIASTKAHLQHSLLPPKPTTALSAEGGSKEESRDTSGLRSPTTLSASKIPVHPDSQHQHQQQHHHQQQQQQQQQQRRRASSRGSGASDSHSGSAGEIGPSFNRSPNPVFKAHPQHSGSTSSRASNASGVASFSTVRNPCYGDALESCTPAYYTPAPFTPGPPAAFTPGPEAAAFAAALEAGLPLSQVANASRSSTSNANGNARHPYALDFSEAANAPTPTSGASSLL